MLNVAFRRFSVRCFSSTPPTVVDLLAETLSRNPTPPDPHLGVERKEVTLARTSKRKKKMTWSRGTVFAPITSEAFSGFPQIAPKLRDRLNREFPKTLEIQDMALPKTLEKCSVIVQAETGSGKTLTYAIPVANRALKDHLNPENCCLILSPTKELAEQIHSRLLGMVRKASLVRLLGRTRKIKLPMAPVIVGTPACVNQLIKQGLLKLHNVSMIVLDEYDRLLGEDFQDQTTHIVRTLSRKKNKPQWIVTSATMPEETRHYLEEMIGEGLEVVSSGHVVPARLTHRWVVTPPHRRTETLIHLLGPNPEAAMVFVQRKDIAESIHEVLTDRGYYAALAHGGLTLSERTEALRSFRSGSVDVLIATDLIGRGVDVPECGRVIQVQPDVEDAEGYLHRAGRAARAGRAGTSEVIVCDKRDKTLLRAITEDGAVEVEVVQAEKFLPADLDPVESALELSLHHMNDEAAFSLDIELTQPSTFYLTMIEELGLKPITRDTDNKKKLFSMWFSTPMEAWLAESAVRRYLTVNGPGGEPSVKVFRHGHRNKWVTDWDSYFNDLRRKIREDNEMKYRNFVKMEMGRKRPNKKHFQPVQRMMPR